MADKLNIPGFKHYELDSVYQAKLAAGEVDAKDLSFVKETGKLYTQGGVYGGGGPKWSYLKGYGVGTIVYHDGTKLKKVSPDKWNASLGTPVGVIVVPKGFAPDGKERMVGLHFVTKNGSIGSSSSDVDWQEGIVAWDSSTYIDSPLFNYNALPVSDNSGGDVVAITSYAYLSSDAFSGVQSVVDPESRYGNSAGAHNMIPSPYIEDRPNPSYYSVLDGYYNALRDFDGFQNTRTLVLSDSVYSAANGAWNYSDGVSDAMWYLPAAGELGFLISRLNTINASITKIGGSVIPTSGSILSIHSSTEVSNKVAVKMSSTSGNTALNMTKTSGLVRPFAIIY